MAARRGVSASVGVLDADIPECIGTAATSLAPRGRARALRRGVFTGVDFGIDGLTSEPVPPVVPGPATLPLVSGDLFLLALRSRRARR